MLSVYVGTCRVQSAQLETEVWKFDEIVGNMGNRVMAERGFIGSFAKQQIRQ